MRELDNYLKENSIANKITAPYLQKQNGKAKRINCIQLWVLFKLFLLNNSFSSYCEPKLQKQLFIYRIKALSVKVLLLYIKILKAKNFF